MGDRGLATSVGDRSGSRRRAERGRFGIDTEFMSEGRYRALLCLVQVAVDDPTTATPQILLIDALDEVDAAPLAELLADPEIEIVLHAGRQDVAILRRAWQTEINNIFDTQIAAGFAGDSAQAGYGEPARRDPRPPRRQDGELHALGRPPADRRAAQLRRPRTSRTCSSSPTSSSDG